MKQTVKPRYHRAHTPKHSQPNTPLQGVFKTLIPELQRAVSAAGYETPTPIQEQSIPHLLRGRDLLGSAQTGTGKTAAFVLPLLQHLVTNGRKAQPGNPMVLILAPTRELAAQIDESIRDYGRNTRIRHTVVFGGVNQFHQVKALNRGVDILVATPGRLLDLMEQGIISLNEIEYFILDEVDRMLDMGFQPDIRRVLGKIPANRQTLFFSATFPPKIEELANTMVSDPVRISIEPEQPAVDRIAQKVMFVGKKQKDALLLSLLDGPGIHKAIVFTQMKHVANKVVTRLQKAGIRGVAIHGNKSQSARTDALQGFKRGRFQVLVATDVAARGLDVDDITHVFNYDLPVEAETYVHRIGRTARAGAGGDAISFCTPEDRAYLHEIEQLLGEPVMADLEHAYHSDEAYRSSLSAPAGHGHGSRSRPRGGRSPRPGKFTGAGSNRNHRNSRSRYRAR